MWSYLKENNEQQIEPDGLWNRKQDAAPPLWESHRGGDAGRRAAGAVGAWMVTLRCWPLQHKQEGREKAARSPAATGGLCGLSSWFL